VGASGIKPALGTGAACPSRKKNRELRGTNGVSDGGTARNAVAEASSRTSSSILVHRVEHLTRHPIHTALDCTT
jgi:hypothetical protein